VIIWRADSRDWNHPDLGLRIHDLSEQLGLELVSHCEPVEMLAVKKAK
jgi:hypothetical protein